MLIANPLYDTAFKSLISDKDVAKAVIGALLETEVLEVDVQPTEYVKRKKKDDKFPRTIRLDYCVTINNQDGEKQKVLIEIQKASGAEAIYRFREYLAVAGYQPKSSEETQIPIITIYFLGFELEKIPTSCLHVSRQYIDMHQKKVINAKEKFVELLTHDSYIVQIPRIKTGKKPVTKLETVLSVFELENFKENSTDVTVNYNFPIKEKYQKKMVDILHYIGTDPKKRRVLDNERYWLIHDELTIGALVKTEKLISEQEKELAKQEKELAKQEKELAKQEKELAEKDKTIANAVISLKKKGMTLKEISEMTGLSLEEIKKIN